ncbi:MAG: hypothetical protein R2754_13315 [Microthrixaceae bacterium]
MAARIVMAGALVAAALAATPGPVGAQGDPPPEVPGYCLPLRNVLNNANQVPLDDEEYQAQVAEGAKLLAALRVVAPAELDADLDALEAFGDYANGVITQAGGIEQLTEAQLVDLIDRSQVVLEPLDTFYGETCPGANVYATLYPECTFGGETSPPSLEVDNVSENPVEVTAGDLVFTVEADGFVFEEVPGDLTVDEILIDGVAGLVERGSCDDFEGPSGLADLFAATFTTGCPEQTPPKLPVLEIGLTEEGLEFLGEFLSVEPEPIGLPFEVDEASVMVELPGGLTLMLPSDATVPRVSLLGEEMDVTVNRATCAPGPTDPRSDPDDPPSAPATTAKIGGAVQAPLAPRFTG